MADKLSSALAAQEKALQRFAARKKSIDQGAASPVGSQGQPRVLDRKEDDTKLDDQGAQDWASQQASALAKLADAGPGADYAAAEQAMIQQLATGPGQDWESKYVDNDTDEDSDVEVPLGPYSPPSARKSVTKRPPAAASGSQPGATGTPSGNQLAVAQDFDDVPSITTLEAAEQAAIDAATLASKQAAQEPESEPEPVKRQTSFVAPPVPLRPDVAKTLAENDSKWKAKVDALEQQLQTTEEQHTQQRKLHDELVQTKTETVTKLEDQVKTLQAENSAFLEKEKAWVLTENKLSQELAETKRDKKELADKAAELTSSLEISEQVRAQEKKENDEQQAALVAELDASKTQGAQWHKELIEAGHSIKVLTESKTSLQEQLTTANERREAEAVKFQEQQLEFVRTDAEIKAKLAEIQKESKEQQRQHVAEVQDLRSKLKTAQLKEEDFTKMVHVLEENVKDMEEQMKLLEEDNRELETDKQELHTTVREFEQRQLEHLQKQKDLESTVEEVSSDLDQVRNVATKLRAEAVEAAEKRRQAALAASQEREELESQKRALASDVEELQGLLHSASVDADSEHKQWQAKYAMLETQHAERVTMAEELEARVHEVTRDLGRANTSITTLANENRELRSQVEDLERELSNKLRDINELQLEKEALTHGLSGKSEQFTSSMDSVRDSFQNTVNELRQALKAEKESYDKLLQDYEERKTAFAAERELMEQKLGRVTADTRKLRAAQKMKVAALNTKVNQMEDKHDELQRQYDKLAREFSQSREKWELRELHREDEVLMIKATSEQDLSSLSQQKSALEQTVEDLRAEVQAYAEKEVEWDRTQRDTEHKHRLEKKQLSTTLHQERLASSASEYDLTTERDRLQEAHDTMAQELQSMKKVLGKALRRNKRFQKYELIGKSDDGRPLFTVPLGVPTESDESDTDSDEEMTVPDISTSAGAHRSAPNTPSGHRKVSRSNSISRVRTRSRNMPYRTVMTNRGTRLHSRTSSRRHDNAMCSTRACGVDATSNDCSIM